jgi:ABC-2 type transport system permease protein
VTRLLRAELLKLRTTRLLLWLGLLIVALVALIVSLNAGQDSAGDLAQAGSQRDLFSISAISAVVALILGIVSSAGEYAHGTAAQTFLVTPVRERVVAAKVLAALVAGAALAAFAEAAAYGLAALWVEGKSAPFQLATHDVLLLALGTLAAGALAGAIGAGLGALVRRQTAAIVVALVWLLVGEPLLAIAKVQRYAPGHTVAAVVEAGRHSGELLHFWPGVLLALGYAAAFAVAGAIAVTRSDVT